MYMELHCILIVSVVVLGICNSSLSDAEAAEINDAKRLDELMRDKQQAEQRVVKILLLGTGESGKSTIFKQMQILYDQDGFNEHEKEFFKTTIRHNVIESMQSLLTATIDKFGLSFKDAESEAASAYLRPLDWYKQGFWTDEIPKYVKHLWVHEPAIRDAYERRSEFQLIDSAGYLFDAIERIGEPNFMPKAEDCLRARHRTSGIVERLFVIEGVKFKFIDVGGQRNERRKWIHCFEDVTCVMFVGAISEFDQTLYEDEKKNRMVESLDVFGKIINEKFFQSSTILLFLNKTDLFGDKLKKAHVRNTFPDYKGDNSFEDAAGFLEKQYLKLNVNPNRTIYSHFTCATDTTNVEKVFQACKETILQQNLSSRMAAAAAAAATDSKGGLEAMSPLDRLHEFCRRGAKVSVQEILTKDKTLLNKKGNLGNIAVHWAASTGQDDTLEYLCSLGATINAQNDVGDTPLHLAVWKDHLSAVRVLKKRKADKSITNQDDKTAPQMARSQTMKELLPEMDETEVANSIQIVAEDDDDDDDEAPPAAAASKPRPPPPKPAGAGGPKPPPPKPAGSAAAAPAPKPAAPVAVKAPPPPPRRA